MMSFSVLVSRLITNHLSNAYLTAKFDFGSRMVTAGRVYDDVDDFFSALKDNQLIINYKLWTEEHHANFEIHVRFTITHLDGTLWTSYIVI